MRRGFLLGKFMPPHNGHVGLCQAAMAQCDLLTVLVCSRDVEPIPGHLRADWMRRLLPEANVVHMHREIPQEPSGHPDFWTIWRQAIREHHPEPIDRVFGSEAYVVKLAGELGAEAVLVDPDRLAFPVSGTAVREDPAGSWRHLPGIVRPWYQRRVVLFGPESVGKSTLAARLAARLDSPYVPEYGRTYDRFRPEAPWSPDDFIRIAQGHVALRDAVAPLAGPILLEDTDPLLTSVWARMLLGRRVPELEEATGLADLYLLLDIDVPWSNDGTRYFGDRERYRFFDLCVQILDARSARYITVSGGWHERQRRAISELSTLRHERVPGRW
jgi:HTH-type transcriptional repressor of NAD biosynthesis genes